MATDIHLEHKQIQALMKQSNNDLYLGNPSFFFGKGKDLVINKRKKGRPLCVLDQDVTCDMVSNLSERAMVRKFEFVPLLQA